MPPKINLTPALAPSNSLSDLDAAIRALELSTNPSKRSKCNCNATRHPLLSSAPNCLSCGKIICVKEGLGPCSFCGNALLSSDEIQSMIRSLKDERGREKMQANNASQRRPDVSKTPRPFTGNKTGTSTALSAAEQHRNRLLSYQASSAQRTHIIDEAADFETPTFGQSMWASPQERALQLKRQQKVLREQEWNAKPEYEKRREVVSIDLVGKKVVKRMANIERPGSDDEDTTQASPQTSTERTSGGTFSRNPLLGGLIRPIYHSNNDVATEQSASTRHKPWRRVQDDDDDNEKVILDGGVYGQHTGPTTPHDADEPACG